MDRCNLSQRCGLFNLGSRDYRDLNSLVTSKINYFLADENNFYGAYARYYIDTSKLSNNTTLQEYPSFQYHRFLNNLFDERLRYSFDASFHNFYRPAGSYANELIRLAYLVSQRFLETFYTLLLQKDFMLLL